MKLCKDCKWLRPRGSRPLCDHPTSVLPGERSLVTGEVTPGARLDCEEARFGWSFGPDYCGQDAKHWEAKDAAPPTGGFV